MALPVAPAARLRRTWPQRLLIGFNILLILGCLGAAGTLGFFYQRFGDINRIDLGNVLSDPDDDAGAEEDNAPEVPQNFLLVGSDSREFVDTDVDNQSFGDVEATGAAKSDTIIVLRVDPRTTSAAMLSFPRDLWVDIYAADGRPTGSRNRINTAFDGGPEQLVQTIRQNFDIPIHHYMQVDFAGFKNLVDVVGGVEVYLENPVRDRDTSTGRNLAGLDIQQTECVNLGGDQALAYVRSRHLQEYVDGRWRSDLSSDFGRIERQQDFIRRAVQKALDDDLFNPVRLNRLVGVADDSVLLDDAIGLEDLVDLGEQFRALAPEALQQFQLLVDDETLSSGARVLLLQPGANEAVLDVLRGRPPGQPQVASPSVVQVEVLNGTGTGGQGGLAATGLREAGFKVGVPGDLAGYGVEATEIRYGADQLAAAQLLQRHLSPGAVLVEDPDVEAGAAITLVTGADFVEVSSVPRAAPATAAAPGATTTTTGPELTEQEAIDLYTETVRRGQCGN